MEKRTPQEVLKFARDNKARVLDLKFVDLPGTWQHVSLPIGALKEDSFEEGFGFDGSSIRGWKHINESDMIIVPDPDTAFIDPFMKEATVSLICNIFDPITKEKYPRDPRGIALKAESYVKSTGVATDIFFGPEAEFFILDDVRFAAEAHEAYYHLDSAEGSWNSGRDEKPNLGYKTRSEEH